MTLRLIDGYKFIGFAFIPTAFIILFGILGYIGAIPTKIFKLFLLFLTVMLVITMIIYIFSASNKALGAFAFLGIASLLIVTGIRWSMVKAEIASLASASNKTKLAYAYKLGLDVFSTVLTFFYYVWLLFAFIARVFR
ncbi:hypothetical protein [Mycoplasma nasistruthionis]|uniref:Uncharacterized protein n=1 Tax=Mycoplasma nasistruthionis TaxID=353852 RepID=A0A4Y6I640_9MOLU|nr:hypothetical protein [Mycoplasma nasistruthionis]QDF65094.1 hypothetical protein FIV53_02220 [Mycoplasma nasistruthionis]